MITMPRRLLIAARNSYTAPAVRYPPDPRALFVLVVCVVVGFPLVFANATPGTIAAQMPTPAIVAWGIMLSGGSLVTLVGALRQTPNGVIAEQVGSIALGFACIIYAFAIYAALHWTGSVPMFILFAFGTASFWRWKQLQNYLRDVEELAIEQRRDAAMQDQADTVARLRDELGIKDNE